MEKIFKDEAQALNSVEEFHALTGNNIEESPVIPSEERCDLRYSLISEELTEFEEALSNGDLVEAADALCDLQYVLAGSVIELGLAGCFAELFAEVHRSNMSKACKNMEEVNDTRLWYAEERGIKNTGTQEVGGVYFVIDKDNNNKTLKSKYYSPADLLPIIEKHIK